MSLYRKYRPQKFVDLIGQEHVKTTLINALQSGKFSQAYLFTGSKGSGKTTTARLLAKALNCTGRTLGPNSFEPCDKCNSCKEVIKGQSLDVIEIDAASNRGIDEIRDLREKIKFAPTISQYKIYVIDECHMLTKEAFNALLKTLEEPPAHAIFVLATTELHKVPATILSRVQIFDFHKAKIEEIVAMLQSIAKAEKLAIEPEVFKLIARLAYGAYRDAVTMLDQVANLQTKEKITLARVQMILGQTTEKSVWDLIEALSQKNRQTSLKIVNDIYFEGKNLENFLTQTIEILRKIILFKSGIANQFELTQEDNNRVQALSQIFVVEELMEIIEKFTDIIPKVKTSILSQLPLEMAIFEITNQNSMSNSQTAKDQFTKTEPIKPGPIIKKSEPSVVEAPIKKEIPDAKRQTPNATVKVWPEIVKIVKSHNNAIAAMLKDAIINSEEEDTITLGVKYKFQAEQLCSAKIRPMIEKAILEATGKNLNLNCEVNAEIKINKPVDRDEALLDNAKEVFDI